MTPPDAFLLLGRDHSEYGSVHVVSSASGRGAAAISVGADPESPSLACKGDPSTCPNEDAALLIDEGRHVLLAVADGHVGEEASHRLLELLHQQVADAGLPRGEEELVRSIRALRYPVEAPADQPEAGSTLIVATLDRDTRRGALVSFGDSTLAWVGAQGEQRINRKIPRFVTLHRPQSLLPGWGHVAAFDVEAGGLLVAFTDGVDECHYSTPRTSVRGRHRADLFREVGSDPRAFAERLVHLALEGVGGHPGGQDNVVVVVART